MPCEKIIYRHFKGDYYLSFGSVTHSDGSKVVLYQKLLTGEVFVRPQDDWGEHIKCDEYEGPRFQLVKPMPLLKPGGHTLVVHCKKEPYDVYVGRPSKWGNDHKMIELKSKEEAIRKYIEDLVNDPWLITYHLGELQGKVLGCFCAPQACHGDVLARLANSYNVPIV